MINCSIVKYFIYKTNLMSSDYTYTNVTFTMTDWMPLFSRLDMSFSLDIYKITTQHQTVFSQAPFT